ncbi:MAG: ABC-F family ATP-binding cassette domain-containing protein [Methanobacteriota archaeon]
MDVIIRARDISKTIEGKLLFDNASFEVYAGDCVGLLGPNGCGKTTLFKIFMGQSRATSGDIWKKDMVRIRCLEQVSIDPQDETVSDFFTRTTQPDSIRQQIRGYETQLEDPMIYNSRDYEVILEKIRKLRVLADKSMGDGRWDAAQVILKEIGLGDLSLDTKIDVFSGGERQKIALASVLAQPQDCDLLLLDEPTNHLDIETIEWLERQIADFPSAVMIISHDQYLLDDLVGRVFEIQDARLELYEASFDEYEEQKQLRQHIKIKEYEKTSVERQRQQAIIKTMSRRNKYDRQIASKMKRLAKQQHVENPVLKSYLLQFHFNTVFKSGKNVAEGHNLKKYFDDKIILDHANFEIFSGQKIGLIGPNGCGKTTFLKILTGEEKIDDGKLHLSSGVKSGYFDQGHLSLVPENTLVDEVRRGQKDLSENDAKALLGQFNFKGPMILNQVQQLSGGERARLALLRLLIQPYNLLLLDEPTNHMDMDSKAAIEQALNSYGGTVIVVSHDRRFLDAVTDEIFYMNNASLKMYPGNYSTFRVQRMRELADLSNEELANYSTLGGLKKYVVCKGFTTWSTKTKHKVGEIILIGDHNEKLFEWEIKNKLLRPINEMNQK